MGFIYGARAASAAVTLASRHKKKPAKAAALDKKAPTEATATPALGRGVTALSYRGQTIPCKRTDATTFKGAGGAEIQALETLLEERRTALLADSTTSFLTVEQTAAIIAAEHTAVAARREWNYAPYRKELALYQQEEARRQKATTAPVK
ncbi:hypothetical protein GCM10027346_03490 [Hymenobacter seoulensis]